MFCKICTSNIGKFVTESPAAQPPSSSAVETENTSSSQQFHCAFCFGLLAEEADGSDQFLEELAQEADALFKSDGYDGSSFLLALNMPTSLLLRESIVERLAQGRWAPTSMSSKELFSRCLMNRLAKVTGLRPSLNSDLVLTVSLEHDQFAASDFHFLLQHFPEEFTNGGGGRNRKRSRNSRKRPRLEEPTNAMEEVEESGEANLEAKDGNEGGGMASLLTKVKVRSIQARLNPEVARKFFPLLPATQRCTFSLAFERDPLFIGGRYRKFSRHLPQSPWGPDSDQRAGDSVSEKIASLMVQHFGASGSRFTASGREDVDVRMLGQGRPFVVQLLNARRTAALLDQKSAEHTLSLLADQINASSGGDIAIGSLARVSTKQALVLNVGQEEKRKTYSALCYSKVPLDEQMLRRLDAAEPVEIVQKTAIRVLKRRPLLERRRTIFWMRALQLDQFHFQLRLQTQAGTYVKEFVHSDFGRTRPSLAELMHLPLGQADILQLDVLAVHLEWPPTSSSTIAAPTPAAHNKSNQSSSNRS